MSPLTKAFIVLVTVLSVLLVALVVPYVAQTEDLSGQISSLEGELRSAEARANSANEEISAAENRVSEQMKLLSQQVAQLTQERIQLQTERDDAKAEALGMKRELAKRDAELSRLSAASLQDANLLTVTTADLKQTRQGLVDAQTKLVQLGDRNNELESQRDSLNGQVNRLGEKMVALEQDNVEMRNLIAKLPDEIRQELTTSTGVKQATMESPVPIAGSITEVQTAAGTQLVQIDVGAKDGVQENMKFLVHRDDQYVGTIVVDKVESAASAGRITLAKGQVRSGDQVYAGPY